VTTDAPDLVGYSETILRYAWSRAPDAAIERVRGGNPADFLGDDSLGAGLQMTLYDLVGKALGVPVYRDLADPHTASGAGARAAAAPRGAGRRRSARGLALPRRAARRLAAHRRLHRQPRPASAELGQRYLAIIVHEVARALVEFYERCEG
jgi:L-alanine-DL-glutamate epimerase-like enolase superfamily enzyme